MLGTWIAIGVGIGLSASALFGLESRRSADGQLLTSIWLAADPITIAVQTLGKAPLVAFDWRYTRGANFIATRIPIAGGLRLQDAVTLLSAIPGSCAKGSSRGLMPRR